MQSDSGDNVTHDVTVYVGQAEVSTRVSIGQLLMVEAHEVQDRGVQIVNVDSVFDGGQSKLIGRAVAESAFDTAAGHPDGVAVVVVVATFLAF